VQCPFPDILPFLLAAVFAVSMYATFDAFVKY